MLPRLLIFAGLAASVAGAARAQGGIELEVDIRSSAAPTEVVLQRDGGVEVIAVGKDGASGLYRSVLARPSAKELASASEVFRPYLLVAGWPDGREQVYLALKPTSPDKLRFRVHHEVLSIERKVLDSIEALGGDFYSLLEKYFRSRAYHRNWRFQVKQPRHQVAVRSARIWFDTAYALATAKDSYFRMDEEVQGYIREYQTEARASAEFSKLLQAYAPSGYIQAMQEQAVAVHYNFVGEIPRLVAERRFEEAELLNTKAMWALANETAETQRIVAKHQGVNLQLLKGNAALLATKRAE